MAIQINFKNGGAYRYCSGECFSDCGAGQFDDAEQCDLGTFTCHHCGDLFTVSTPSRLLRYMKLSDDGGGFLIVAAGDGYGTLLAELQYLDDEPIGTKYTIEIIEALPDAVNSLPEFDGF